MSGQEIHSILQRLDAFEKKIDSRLDRMEEKNEKREEKNDKRFESLQTEIAMQNLKFSERLAIGSVKIEGNDTEHKSLQNKINDKVDKADLKWIRWIIGIILVGILGLAWNVIFSYYDKQPIIIKQQKTKQKQQRS